jgi:hypothetical protein
VGRAAACRALNVPRASLYRCTATCARSSRQLRPRLDRARPAPCRLPNTSASLRP